MTTWVLIIAFYAGTMSGSDAVAITNVPGFTSAQGCLVAGQKTKSFSTFKKDVSFVCVKHTTTK